MTELQTNHYTTKSIWKSRKEWKVIRLPYVDGQKEGNTFLNCQAVKYWGNSNIASDNLHTWDIVCDNYEN